MNFPLNSSLASKISGSWFLGLELILRVSLVGVAIGLRRVGYDVKLDLVTLQYVAGWNDMKSIS